MSNLPPLAAIRVFEAAARHANFTRAAGELGLTQAGVSYQIKVLEERVGTVLFVRQGRGMALTPAGEALAPRISQAFADMQGAFEGLRGDDNAVLSVACAETMATQFLAPRLGCFQLAHPDIAVRIDVSDLIVDLDAGACDVAIRFTRDPPERLHSHFLMRGGIAPMASPAFAEARALRLPADLSRDCRVSPDYTWWDRWDEATCHKHDGSSSKAVGALQFDSQVLDAQAASSGHGAALLMPPMFMNEVADGRLVRPFAEVAWLTHSFRLVYPEVRKGSAKVRAFRTWLDKELRDLMGDDPEGFLVEGGG
ncbi:MAG: LysR substrate-binding domain-containing protein [Pseudomonadota bacterium]